MTKDIFISHAWGIDEQGIDNHKNCKDLCNKLINNGYSVWFDHYDMQSNIDNSIMLSINECKVFLVCLTMEYCNKINNNHNIIISKYNQLNHMDLNMYNLIDIDNEKLNKIKKNIIYLW